MTMCNVIRIYLTCISIFLLLFPFPSGAENVESPWSFTGYIKSTLMGQRFAVNAVQPPLEHDKEYVMLQNKLRVRLFHEPSDVFSLEAAYEITPMVSNPHIINSQGFVSPKSSSFRIHDLNEELFNGSGRDMSVFQNLDRLNLNFSLPFADIHMGRQAIAFGSGKSINPTDLFSPFLFQDLNKEEKTGVDAVRIRIPNGDMSEIDLGAVMGKDFKGENSALYLRTRLYLWNTDLSLIAMDFQDNLMLGFDMTRALFDAGFWLEGTHIFANLFDEHIGEEDYFNLITGVDYSFENNTYLFMEYYYNSAGTRAKEEYITNTIRSTNPLTNSTTLKTAYATGNTYLLGKHYLIPGVTYEFTPLFSGTIHSLINLTDFSMYMGLRAEYNLMEDLFLEGGAFRALGESADRHGLMEIPQSEFGLYSNMIFVGIRFYF